MKSPDQDLTTLHTNHSFSFDMSATTDSLVSNDVVIRLTDEIDATQPFSIFMDIVSGTVKDLIMDFFSVWNNGIDSGYSNTEIKWRGYGNQTVDIHDTIEFTQWTQDQALLMDSVGVLAAPIDQDFRVLGTKLEFQFQPSTWDIYIIATQADGTVHGGTLSFDMGGLPTIRDIIIKAPGWNQGQTQHTILTVENIKVKQTLV